MLSVGEAAVESGQIKDAWECLKKFSALSRRQDPIRHILEHKRALIAVGMLNRLVKEMSLSERVEKVTSLVRASNPGSYFQNEMLIRLSLLAHEMQSSDPVNALKLVRDTRQMLRDARFAPGVRTSRIALRGLQFNLKAYLRRERVRLSEALDLF